LKRHANKEAEEDDGSDDDDANTNTIASNAFGGTGQEEEQDVNVAGHPTTTLAGVLVRCSAGVEDRNEESVSRGTQVVEDYFTGCLIPSTPNICVKTRTPTQEELDTCIHVHSTSDREWEPKDIKFPQVGAIRREVSALLPLSHRYKADRIHQLPTDTVDGRCKSGHDTRTQHIYFYHSGEQDSTAGDAERESSECEWARESMQRQGQDRILTC
jgi:hypothetical protein